MAMIYVALALLKSKSRPSTVDDTPVTTEKMKNRISISDDAPLLSYPIVHIVPAVIKVQRSASGSAGHC